MVVGHVGVGLAAKRVAPQAPLWVLLFAGLFLDIVFVVCSLIGVEHYSDTSTTVNPYSHGLLMSVFWSIAGGVITFLLWRDRRTSVVVGLVLFSHWMLDFIAHNPDLPLSFDGSPLVGLSLEWSFTGTGYVIHWTQALVIELGLLISGMVIYLSTTKTNAPAKTYDTPHNDAPSYDNQ